jgi:homoserine dehydrogenase
MSKVLGIGIAGLGTVGTGFLKQLKGFKSKSTRSANIKVIKIAVKSLKKKRDLPIRQLPLTSNTMSLADDESIDVVVELIGGSKGIAYNLVKRSLKNKKHVITANKALMALHGNELAKIAEKNNVSLNYEAAIAGGIPIVKAVRDNLRFNKIKKIYGILNGTCNYILTKMDRNLRDFKDVLSDAQKKGFAELDPTFDIEGIDAAHKITLLSCLAFDVPISFISTYIEGITKIDTKDFKYASEFGYVIKLLAVSSKVNNKVEQRVHPCFVKQASDIAKVENELNAVIVEDNVIGKNMFQGPGAGAGPTGASVMSDLMEIVRGTINMPLGSSVDAKNKIIFQKIENLSFPYYVRITGKDRAGVMAKISRALSKKGISIRSIIQKPSEKTKYAEIILITHKVKETSLKVALNKIKRLPEVAASAKFIRIEDSL